MCDIECRTLEVRLLIHSINEDQNIRQKQIQTYRINILITNKKKTDNRQLENSQLSNFQEKSQLSNFQEKIDDLRALLTFRTIYD